MGSPIRILFLADSHLGFDLPVRPRVERRRRGHDFLANYARALEPAIRGEVDLVVHGGDVFDRPRVPVSLAYQAYEPLVQIAERGVPVFIVPGNHERSALPHARFAAHRSIHVFDRPRTIPVEIRGTRIVIAGFPYERRNVRARFAELLHCTGWQQEKADARVLCVHHCVEGATVGPADFTFTSASDVIRCADLPPDFAVVLSGHIHRWQSLVRDLRRRPLPTPVLYPGSIERTSIAEAGEEKGFMIVTVTPDECGGRASWEFRRLHARPMIVQEISVHAHDPGSFESAVAALINAAPADAVLRIRLNGEISDVHSRVLAAANLRRLAPASMNVEIMGWNLRPGIPA